MTGSAHNSSDVSESWREWLSDIFGVVAVAVFLGFLFSGCGGGTSGTGIRSEGSVLQGSVRTTEGEPIPGVVVTIIETDEQTVTDADGDFEISVSDPIDDFVVDFEGQGVDSQVAVSGVPSEATTVDVTLTVDGQTGELSGTSVQIEGEGLAPTGTPSPSPTDIFTPLPMPTPVLSDQSTPSTDELI